MCMSKNRSFSDPLCRVLFLQFMVDNALSAIFPTNTSGYLRLYADAWYRNTFFKASVKLRFPSTAWNQNYGSCFEWVVKWSISNPFSYWIPYERILFQVLFEISSIDGSVRLEVQIRYDSIRVSLEGLDFRITNGIFSTVIKLSSKPNQRSGDAVNPLMIM